MLYMFALLNYNNAKIELNITFMSDRSIFCPKQQRLHGIWIADYRIFSKLCYTAF